MVQMKDKTETVASLSGIVVPAGTDPNTIDPNDATSLTPQEAGSQYSIPMPMNIDVNLYVFMNDYSLPFTDGNVHRAYERMLTPAWTRVESNSFPGLEPHYNYATLNGRASPSSFEFIIFSHVPGQTQMRLAKPDGTGVLPAQAAVAGINTFEIPADLRGTYVLSLTKDGGSSWQRLCSLRLFNGEAPWGPEMFLPESTMSVNFDEEDTSFIRKINKNGELQAAVMVEEEDFELPVMLTLTDTVSNTVISSLNAFDNPGTNTSIIFKGTDTSIAFRQVAVYTFTMPLDDLSDGAYMAAFTRGSERMDYFRFEKFNGAYFILNIDELPIRPTEMGFGEGQYIRIWLSDEKVHIGNINSGFFSINGGTSRAKWEPMSRFNANNISKWLDRGLTLWFSDIVPTNENAKFIKFPTIAPRVRAPKIEVNYRLAHMVGDELVYDGWENRWVAVVRGTSAPLGDKWSYLLANSSGKPNKELGSFRMSAAGIPIPECDEKENENTGMISHRSVRENYFVYRAPYIENGVIHPATKSVRLRVSCYGAPRAVRVNYKTEMMRVNAGVFIHEGLPPDLPQLATVRRDISVTDIIDESDYNQILDYPNDPYWFLGMGGSFAFLEYSIAPTAKKPASGVVFHSLAERREGIEEDTFSEREIKPSALNKNGKFRPAKALEFRTVGTQKWGSFKQPTNGDAQIEFRFKANAKSGRLFYEGGNEWFVDDGVILKRFEGDFEELERNAAGEITPFIYEWGTLANGKQGITRVISDVDEMCCSPLCNH